MNIEKFLILAKKSYKSALLFGFFLSAVSFLTLITFQKSFRSSTDLLIVQNQQGQTDYYTLSRSSDFLSKIVTESIYSEKFLNEVIAGGKVFSDFVSEDKSRRLKEWQKIVRVKKNSDAGILNVRIFGDTQAETIQISEGVLDVLINKNSLFLGQGQSLEMRILSGPIVEKNPSFSQIALASLGGFLLGIFLTMLFVIYREEFFGDDDDFLNKTRASFRNEFSPRSKEQYFKENLKIAEENNPDYLSEDSEYWKKRLENLS